MPRSLLVGIDGSPAGEAALDLAIRWATRDRALVVGLGIVDEPGIHGPEEALVGEAYFARINQSLLDSTRVGVDQALERCAFRCVEAGVAFKPLEDVGTPHVQILREAQRYDLVVLGRETHFRFGWEAISDDTLARVLESSPRPVVAVPQEAPARDPILVAFDGSLQAARALGVFVASGLGAGQPIHLVNAASDPVEAAQTLERASDFLHHHELSAEAHVVTGFATPAEAILELAGRLESGLIVMGAYGQPLLREFFLGSVTRSVLKKTTIPVFLYH
jgi:nucleotide-binding universal stress UspA family protein